MHCRAVAAALAAASGLRGLSGAVPPAQRARSQGPGRYVTGESKTGPTGGCGLCRRPDASTNRSRGAYLTILKRLTLNLIRLNPVKRKGSFRTKRIIAATSDECQAHLLGLE